MQKFPELKLALEHSFNDFKKNYHSQYSESVFDIIFSTVGWISVTPFSSDSIKLKIYTPGGVGSEIRTPSLTPYDVLKRGKKKGSKYNNNDFTRYNKVAKIFREKEKEINH
jgi:hypothetical protein